MPEISVIVPIYNVDKYLDRCVSSILNQTFTDFELILVDDGSPDNCGKMCDEYAKADQRIRVIHKENGGLSDARNVAINIAKGEFLSFIDADDYVSDSFLADMYFAIRENECKMSVSNILSIDDKGKIDSFYFPANEIKVVNGEEMYESLYQPSACNKLYHKSIFNDIRYPKGRLFEDCFVYHLILEKLDKFVYVGKPLYYYFIRSDSIMHNKYSLKDTDIVEAFYERAIYLDSHGHHLYADEAYLSSYSRLASAFTYLDTKDMVVKKRLDELMMLYKRFYKRLVNDKHIIKKQKLKLFLFRYFPRFHSRVFPMYMK